MENPNLLEAVRRRGEWLMAHHEYSLGLNETNTAWRLYNRDETRLIDEESFNALGTDDEARAINALLDRHP